LHYFLAVFLEKGELIMLLRKAKVGKAVLFAKVIELSENYAMAQVPCSYYTASPVLLCL